MDYFNVVSRRDFHRLCAEFKPARPAAACGLDKALGLVLGRDVVAGEDIPFADRSSMDGFAVSARDVFGAGESNPAYVDCVGEVLIEKLPEAAIEPGQCMRIPTGGYLPRGADAVVMVEYTQDLGGDTIEVHKSLAPGDNVLLRGEDVAQGDKALEAGTRIRPQEIGMLAALGVVEVLVRQRPRVAILSTGNELVAPGEPCPPGGVRDVNSHAVAALVEQAGGEAVNMGIVPDELDKLVQALERATGECDMVLLSGGSSIGVRDLTVEALSRLPDSELLVHGVSIRPGKPTILARVGRIPVMGLPGQVTSAQVVVKVLADPLIRHLAGERDAFEMRGVPVRRAELTRNLPSVQGREDFMRVSLEERPGKLPLAHPVLAKSGLLKSLVRGNGLAPIPAEAEGLYGGSEIDVWLI